MGVEIERKFLVRDPASALGLSDPGGILMRQGYLAINERCCVRVRTTSCGQAWLVVKSAESGLTRDEFTLDLHLDAARGLLKLCTGTVIDKERRLVHHEGHTWEVDFFRGANAGLVIAEIELDDEDESFERPAWLGEEVTGDERFYNASLALHPYGEWGLGDDP